MTTEPRPSAPGFRLLKDNRLRLLTDGSGAVEPDKRGLGLYAGDTRFACRLGLSVAGRRPRADPGLVLAAGPGRADRFELLSGRAGLGLWRDRELGQGLSESLTLALAGPGSKTVAVRLTIGFDSADIFEIRGYRRRTRGQLLPVRIEGSRIRFGYLGRDGRLRTLDVEVQPRPSLPVVTTVLRGGHEVVASVVWHVLVGSGSSARLGWMLEPAEVVAEDATAASRSMATTLHSRGRRSRLVRRPAARQAEIRVDDGTLQRILDRAQDDLSLLSEDGPGPGERFVAAGLPWFAALFGRDSVLTAFEAIAFRPALARDALAILAGHQAQAADGRRDAQPGQILHELRTGEMARLGEVPFGPSFGSVDSTPLWLILLGEANAWGADQGLLDRLWPAALRALDWIDARIRTDPDGFLRYIGRPGALANEGWKDSPDAIRDRSGAIVPAPIALAEVQGYVYNAWQRLAGIARARADPALATRLRARARRLKARFNSAFWVRDRQGLALAIGRAGQLADAVSSNAGQCLWTGILDRGNEQAVAGRILGRDMDSGWGIRTLASSEPGYDPLGYHIGSVWPHDTALIAGGLKRAGFDEAAVGLADRLLEAAAAMPQDRLPELISGEQRRPGRLPGVVPEACLVQAWASAAPLHLVRSLLGFQPNAAIGRLALIRPALPTSVSTLRISGLALGSGQVDLDIRRTRRGVRVTTPGPGGSIRVSTSR